MLMTAPARPLTTPSSPAGGRLVAPDGRELPLEGVHLAATAGGGVARVVLTQRFRNASDQPLDVQYLLPLPSDGAVSGFSFVLGDERIVGQVEPRQAARERFEQALVEGRTAALLDQERTSVFTQRVGNVPPRAEVVVEVTLDQPLRWLEEGAWEWRFPTVVSPRYHGAAGVVPDAAALDVPVQERGLAARATLSLDILDRLTGELESPTHPMEEARGESPVQVRLAGDQGVRLDRDVVVRWPVALPDVSASVLAARPATAAHDGDAFALLTVAPPTTLAGGWTPVPRDLTFLIDASGSMSGRPLAQAATVVAAMIDTLGVNDRIELIAFGSRPTRWKDAPTPATEASKQAAIRWAQGLRASGGTEMHRALLEAMRPLRPDSQRQVVLVTDGQIGFEQQIVKTLLDELPAGARLHTVGVGSGVNRSLTQAAARAGHGCELIVGVDEDAARVVERLVARTTAPLVTDLTLEGAGVVEVAPRRLPDLFAEAPALIALRARSSGGEVVLRGRTARGAFEQRLHVPALAPGEGPAGVAALFAREKVEDLETSLTAGASRDEVERTIEATGVEFQVATRLTSWVAVSARVTVQPGAPRRTIEQPHEVPHAVSVEGLGLRGSLEVLAQGGMGVVYKATLAPGQSAADLVRRMAAKREMSPSRAPADERSARSTRTEAGAFDAEAFARMGMSMRPPTEDDLRLTRDGAVIGGPPPAEPMTYTGIWAPAPARRAHAPRRRRGLLLLLLVVLAFLALVLWRAGVGSSDPAAPATNESTSPEGVGPR